MSGLLHVTDLSTDLFLQELKILRSSIDDTLQINLTIGGGIVVDGFKSIYTLKLTELCRKYGKRFDVNLKENKETIQINFSVIPEYFQRSSESSSILAPQVPQLLGTNQTIPEKILSASNGTLLKTITTKSTKLLKISADNITSDTVRIIQTVHQVVNIRILPSTFEVTLMQENDSRTSLAFLKEHKPALFTCVNNKRKYSACKPFSFFEKRKKRILRKKKRGYALWPLW